VPIARTLEAASGWNLAADEQTLLMEHLDGCADCRKTLEILAGGSDSLLAVARQRMRPRMQSSPALNEVVAKTAGAAGGNAGRLRCAA